MNNAIIHWYDGNPNGWGEYDETLDLGSYKCQIEGRDYTGKAAYTVACKIGDHWVPKSTNCYFPDYQRVLTIDESGIVTHELSTEFESYYYGLLMQKGYERSSVKFDLDGFIDYRLAEGTADGNQTILNWSYTWRSKERDRYYDRLWDLRGDGQGQDAQAEARFFHPAYEWPFPWRDWPTYPVKLQTIEAGSPIPKFCSEDLLLDDVP